ncbi:MAG TPA: acetoacetate decarboxylase family protein [Aeromicrobium sp.]|nr:acetoacetate decarboxylase family protein [Aeromicrobium sp.]
MGQPEPFFSVPRTTKQTSEGPVELPILYYDTTSVVAGFFGDLAAATAEVAPLGLRPALTRKNRSAVFIAGYDYRLTTVGPYFEVAIAIPVVQHDAPKKFRWNQMLADVDGGRDLAFHILHLPVSTAAANAAGRDIWGFPKFVTKMDVQANARDIVVQVEDPDGGEKIMNLQGSVGLSVPSPALSLLLYSELDGDLVRSTANVRGVNKLYPTNGLRLTVGASEHPMAQTLRRLDLDGAKPWNLMATHRFQSRLNDGVVVKSQKRAEASS